MSFVHLALSRLSPQIREGLKRHSLHTQYERGNCLMELSHSLVICTIARPQEVRLTVESAFRQSILPAMVLVVDASGTQAVSQALDSAQIPEHLRERLIRVNSEPGLPLQRNIGIAETINRGLNQNTIVHFVDDDVILHHDYIKQISLVFTSFPDAVVVGGKDLNRKPRRPALLGRVTLTDSRREGAILRSGFNVICENRKNITRVEWVSGLSQSFRLSQLGNTRFNEKIRFYGEEVEMHVRCSQLGSIYWTPDAHLWHNTSRVGREASRSATHEVDNFKWSLVQEYQERFSRVHFIYATFSHMCIKYLQARFTQSTDAKAMAMGHKDFFLALIKRVNAQVVSSGHCNGG